MYIYDQLLNEYILGQRFLVHCQAGGQGQVPKAQAQKEERGGGGGQGEGGEEGEEEGGGD